MVAITYPCPSQRNPCVADLVSFQVVCINLWYLENNSGGISHDCIQSLLNSTNRLQCSDFTRASWRLESSGVLLFVQQLVKANNKEILNLRITDHLWRGYHRWPMDSSHNWPVMQKAISCPDVIICHHVIMIIPGAGEWEHWCQSKPRNKWRKWVCSLLWLVLWPRINS